MLAQFPEDLLGRPARALLVAGARAFVADPDPVDAHLQELLDLVLAEGLDAREGEDGEGPAGLDHEVPELHGPLFVEQEILVDDREGHVRVHVQVALDHLVDVPARRQELDVLALEEMRGAAEVAAVGTAQPGEDHARVAGGLAEDLELAHDQGMLVRPGLMLLAQEIAHELHALAPADVVGVRLEVLLAQDRAVAAQDDLALGENARG